MKTLALLNILDILVTLLTSQELISPLKLSSFLNASLILDTLLTSQIGISPYSLLIHIPSTGLVFKQEFIAVWKLSFVIGVSAPHHLPQIGLFAFVSGEDILKLLGSELILKTHQPDKFWLKVVASLNIPYILVTLLTSQAPISWLNDCALPNIRFIYVTLLTTQEPISWLKALAS